MKPPVIAVFTKNRTNADYEGAQVGADRVAAAFGARAVHYVPQAPDDPSEQGALIERAIAERPDAIVLVPVHQSEIDASILKIDAARVSLPQVAGVNAVPEAIAAIKAGRMLATADFDAMKMACIATEAALRHLRGEALPSRIMLPVQIVDASNCVSWNRPYAERDCPGWADVIG